MLWCLLYTCKKASYALFSLNPTPGPTERKVIYQQGKVIYQQAKTQGSLLFEMWGANERASKKHVSVKYSWSTTKCLVQQIIINIL